MRILPRINNNIGSNSRERSNENTGTSTSAADVFGVGIYNHNGNITAGTTDPPGLHGCITTAKGNNSHSCPTNDKNNTSKERFRRRKPVEPPTSSSATIKSERRSNGWVVLGSNSTATASHRSVDPPTVNDAPFKMNRFQYVDSDDAKTTSSSQSNASTSSSTSYVQVIQPPVTLVHKEYVNRHRSRTTTSQQPSVDTFPTVSLSSNDRHSYTQQSNEKSFQSMNNECDIDGYSQQLQSSSSSLSLIVPPITATLPPTMIRRTSSGSVLSQYQSTSISKHYQIVNQILASFESYYSSQLYVTAYCVGLQFIETVLLEIPKHGYYKSIRHEDERLQCNVDAARVAHILQNILVQSHQQDLTHNHQESVQAAATIGNLQQIEELYRLALSEIEQASIEQQNHRDEIRETHQQQQQQQQTQDQPIAEFKAESKEKIYSSRIIGNANAANEEYSCGAGTGEWDMCDYIRTAAVDACSGGSNRKNFFASPKTTTVKKVSMIVSPNKFQRNTTSWQKPQKPVESKATKARIPTKTQDDQESSLSDSFVQIEKAFFLSGFEVSHVDHKSATEERDNASDSTLGYYQTPNPEQQQSNSSLVFDTTTNASINKRITSFTGIQLQTLAALYKDDFIALQSSGRIRISFVNTYQGRIVESTNCCAVIAPLVCIHHLLNDDTVTGTSSNTAIDDTLDNNEIIQVIDTETPVIAKSIRTQLGVAENAFLIPSDVHDYLLEHGQLSSSQFLTVTGGNILDECHIQTFITELDNASTTKTKEANISSERRIAATFFFHEHVASILKVTNCLASSKDKTSYFYEFIDSLPIRLTFRRDDESNDDMFRRFKIDLSQIKRNQQLQLPNNSTVNAELTSSKKNTTNITMADYIDLNDDDNDDVMMQYYKSLEAEGRLATTGGRNNKAFDESSNHLYERHDHLLAVQEKEQDHRDTETRRKNKFDRLRIPSGGPQGQYDIEDNVNDDAETDNTDNDNIDDDDDFMENSIIIPGTVRVRCSDSESLGAFLRWYACSKFTTDNISYINQYDWDDSNCDFDPRVFQAFVWTS